MARLKYYDMIRSKDHRYSWRLALVLHARSHGIRSAARHFDTTRQTVRVWLRRYEAKGRTGLVEQSRAPKSCPHKTKPANERAVREARRVAPCLGPRRLKDQFGLTPSIGAISRILRQAGLTVPRKKKRARKNDLRAIKARYAPFQRLQADTKTFADIEAYVEQMRQKDLPERLYSHVDVKSGALHADCANELSAFYATAAACAMLEHLERGGVQLSEVVCSTDNGTEYGGTQRHERQHGFPAAIRQTGATHRFLPPATPNAHANVESFHAFIEREFLELERFESREDFFRKLTAYQHWWNFARPNYSKGGKTPAQILEEEGLNPALLLHPPIDLDQWLRNLSFDHAADAPGWQGGQDVPVLPGYAQLGARAWERPPGSARLGAPSASLACVAELAPSAPRMAELAPSAPSMAELALGVPNSRNGLDAR